jgi:hypothetical protein
MLLDCCCTAYDSSVLSGIISVDLISSQLMVFFILKSAFKNLRLASFFACSVINSAMVDFAAPAAAAAYML